MKGRTIKIGVLALLALLALASCRRDLWVLTDIYRQVELYTDWSLCDRKPDGMTAWFMSETLDGRNRRITTSEVEHTWLNLPRGRFTGIIFDWSPAEYVNQDFVGMTRPDSAHVKVRPAKVQPLSDEDLYGIRAIPTGLYVPKVDSTGLCLLSVTPDPMCADTLHGVEVVTGVDGDLILYDGKDSYEASLVTQTIHSRPQPVTWDLRIIVHIKGAQYMHSVKGTVAGLSEGLWLSKLRHMSTACLHPLDEWSVQPLSENVSAITTSIHTFGLPEPEPTRSDPDILSSLPPLRINLRFLLRDEATVIYAHFDVDASEVTVYEDQLIARIEIPIEVELPYVDAKSSAGFDATVTPWEQGGDADVNM